MESAAAILFLQLIFPGRVPPLVKRLAWMGGLSMGAQAAGALIPEEKKEEIAKKIRQRSSSLLENISDVITAPMRGASRVTGGRRIAGNS